MIIVEVVMIIAALRSRVRQVCRHLAAEVTRATAAHTGQRVVRGAASLVEDLRTVDRPLVRMEPFREDGDRGVSR